MPFPALCDLVVVLCVLGPCFHPSLCHVLALALCHPKVALRGLFSILGPQKHFTKSTALKPDVCKMRGHTLMGEEAVAKALSALVAL